MKPIEKAVVAIGALDSWYIGWIGLNVTIYKDAGLNSLWQSFVSFGLPYPALQFAAILLFYVSILVCGIALLSRYRKLAWINYAQFPFRIMLVVPTLYPMFYLIGKLGLHLGLVISAWLLVVTELGRVAIVYRWQRYTP